MSLFPFRLKVALRKHCRLASIQREPLETYSLKLMNKRASAKSLKNFTQFSARIFIQANVEWQMAAKIFPSLPSKIKKQTSEYSPSSRWCNSFLFPAEPFILLRIRNVNTPIRDRLFRRLLLWASCVGSSMHCAWLAFADE